MMNRKFTESILDFAESILEIADADDEDFETAIETLKREYIDSDVNAKKEE